MGIFRKIGGFIASGAKNFGQIGGAVIGKIGGIKSSYDNINNAFGGIGGKQIEGLPLIGPVLGGIGKFLNNNESVGTLTNVMKRAELYGKDLERVIH